MAFKEVAIESLEFNPFTKISKEWMLVTAGDEKKSNTMTASWGGVGIMWGKNIATAYIRPQRYTKKFMDETGMYTLSFLSEDYRKALSVCGSVSGKDVEDKWKEAGLHPYAVDGTTAVEEADLIFVCKTQYTQDMKPECFDVKKNNFFPVPSVDSIVFKMVRKEDSSLQFGLKLYKVANCLFINRRKTILNNLNMIVKKFSIINLTSP